MQAQGIGDDVIKTIVWDNPRVFFGQSGRFDVDDLDTAKAADRTQLFESNSVLRGERETAKSR